MHSFNECIQKLCLSMVTLSIRAVVKTLRQNPLSIVNCKSINEVIYVILVTFSGIESPQRCKEKLFA